MRKIVLLVLFLSFISLSNAQNRVLSLDSLKKNYRVESFVLNSNSFYESNHEIELYNVWIDSTHLVVFACLPNFYEDGAIWSESEEGKTVIDNDVFYKKADAFKRGFKFENSLGAILFKQQKGKLNICKNTFIQYFVVQNLPKGINTPSNVININRSYFSTKNMIEWYPKIFNGQKYDLSFSFFDSLRGQNDDFLTGYYLSKKTNVKGLEGYCFWTFPKDIVVNDYFNIHNGLERFMFVPNIGIVGASFDFFFSFTFPKSDYPRYKRYGVTIKEWNANVLNERMMIADGF